MKSIRIYGFSLVELLITLAIASILLAIAVPNFSTLVLNNRMEAQSNDFLTALQLARSEAVKRGRRVSVCRSSNGTACATTGNWDQGWIVFIDAGVAGEVNTGDSVVRVFSGLSGNSRLVGTVATSGPPAYADATNSISYLPNGATSLTPRAKIMLCPPAQTQVVGRDIQIEGSGRARVQRPPEVACS